ncbi:cytochrome P450 [Aspergillus carlsbadensis]|nr:cytochrome P450 [Aspergillus carlsbadensis]
MTTMSTPAWAGFASLAGVISHLAIFIRGDWDKHTPSIVKFYAAAEAVVLVLVRTLLTSGLYNSIFCVLVLNIGYFLGLFGSIGLYRACFHPLRSFRGPLLAKLSTFWSARETARNYRFHVMIDEMHRTYGDFVRIRPREISINNVDALSDIHSRGSVCTRGPYYDLWTPYRSIHTTRDTAYHSQRRRAWDQGFTATALNQYHPRIRRHCRDLVAQIARQKGEPINPSAWMNFFAFDVMGDLTFGKTFGMLEDVANARIPNGFVESLPLYGIGRCVPWLFIALQLLPDAVNRPSDFVNWSIAQFSERKRMGQSRTDLFTYILGEGVEQTKTFQISDGDLAKDALTAIVAGSDTASSALSAALYLLAKHPEQQGLLQEELDKLTAQAGGEEPSCKMLLEAPFLNSCINEALRLYPPIPGNVQRLTPPGGTTIAGRFIPGDTIVSTPTYAIHRDSRNFPNPHAFIPARWSNPDSPLVTWKDAFNPFLMGLYSCVGKPLALLEMRMCLASLVSAYSFRFPDAAAQQYAMKDLFDGENGVRDHFTAHAPDYELIFVPRG